jgi:uncharacterized membrane protein
MTTRVEKSVTVEAPVSVAYNTWTQFEDFPLFMGGVKEVRQLGDSRLHWVAEIGGVKREWDAAILEQVPDEKIAWAATEGATNAGTVHFSPAGPDRTVVTLTLEYEPEGLVEKAGDQLNIVERRAEADMENFRKLMESGGREPGGWRGAINPDAGLNPGVESAAGSQGDSGKSESGISGKAVAAGVAAAAVAAAGAAAVKSATGSESSTETREVEVDVVPTQPTEVVTTQTTDVVSTPPADDVVITETPDGVVEDVVVEDTSEAPKSQTYPVADDPEPFGSGLGYESTDDDRRV